MTHIHIDNAGPNCIRNPSLITQREDQRWRSHQFSGRLIGAHLYYAVPIPVNRMNGQTQIDLALLVGPTLRTLVRSCGVGGGGGGGWVGGGGGGVGGWGVAGGVGLSGAEWGGFAGGVLGRAGVVSGRSWGLFGCRGWGVGFVGRSVRGWGGLCVGGWGLSGAREFKHKSLAPPETEDKISETRRVGGDMGGCGLCRRVLC